MDTPEVSIVLVYWAPVCRHIWHRLVHIHMYRLMHRRLYIKMEALIVEVLEVEVLKVEALIMEVFWGSVVKSKLLQMLGSSPTA